MRLQGCLPLRRAGSMAWHQASRVCVSVCECACDSGVRPAGRLRGPPSLHHSLIPSRPSQSCRPTGFWKSCLPRAPWRVPGTSHFTTSLSSVPATSSDITKSGTSLQLQVILTAWSRSGGSTILVDLAIPSPPDSSTVLVVLPLLPSLRLEPYHALSTPAPR